MCKNVLKCYTTFNGCKKCAKFKIFENLQIFCKFYIFCKILYFFNLCKKCVKMFGDVTRLFLDIENDKIYNFSKFAFFTIFDIFSDFF